ncbi:hypothetical protein [uncultured Draconibacterium sp.]|uniref:hypothetical protein n=1 Tax=uncultured Draconibacterium sp. TaxID=1573823 RepID=UPI0029C79FDC|nr:hypothetical protein [uncultured Draconibacterium sp.]
MRRIISLILISISITTYSQESEKISYELYLKYSCDSILTKSTGFWLTINENDSTYSFMPDSNGICIVPKKGLYNLEYYSQKGNIRRNLEINSDIIDTLIVPPIYLSATTGHIGPTYYFYVHCGEKCNGKYMIHRRTGELWQKGKFKKGQLGKLTTYSKNGQIESLKKNGFLNDKNVEYDVNGKLLMEFKFFLFYSKVKFYNPKTNEYFSGRFLGHY